MIHPLHLRALCVLTAIASLFVFKAASRAQNFDPLWQPLGKTPATLIGATPWVRPPVHAGFVLNTAAMRAALAGAPKENLAAPARFSGAMPITIPMPDGTLARFDVIESSVMAPELAAQFPEIKTYLGVGVDDPAAAVRLDLTPAGFHAQILSPHGAVYVDPLWQGETTQHASYYKRNHLIDPDGWQCFRTNATPEAFVPPNAKAARTPGSLARSGDTLRTYRLAVAATGEYTMFHGGSVSAGMSAIVTAVNRVTGVYETELAIRLVLVANNNLIVYTSSGSDPYSNNNSSSLLTQNQANLDAVIGDANYDIGHVFSTAGGGLAGLGVVCVSGAKAEGETGRAAPTGDPYYIDYVAHEIGHQFGADHTFNSTTGSCSGNRNAATAFEPGSGTTIMAYAGICTVNNVQPNSDPYFHAGSFNEINTFITSGAVATCPVSTATSNTAPAVSAGVNYTIPKSTPFILTATGSDPNGDTVLYCWEEMDLGASQSIGTADNGASPLFRSYNPTTNAWRTFPTLSAILNNTNATGEQLPTLARTANFRVTARDNRPGGGGIATADMQLTVDATSGPFTVTSPNSSVTWNGLQTVTWNVAGTTNAAVNCQTVNLRLSADGGLTFPYLLAAAVPNSGSASVVMPALNSSTARLKVEAANNVFFDISDANFTVTNTTPAPFIVLNSAALVAESCAPTNGAMDPGELVAVKFVLQNIGSTNALNLIVTLRATNGVTAPSSPITNLTLVPGALTTNTFTFAASGVCGGSLVCLLDAQAGTNVFGPFSSPFTLGAATSVLRSFTNTTFTDIPNPANANGNGAANPYPSTIAVSNLTGVISKATVTLTDFSHTWPSDTDILLVGPRGQKVLLMSDAGGSSPVFNRTLTFDDSAVVSVSASSLPTGTYRPTDYTIGDTITNAPAGPYGTNLSVFNNTPANGTWSLYIQDDGGGDTGSINGWILNLTVTNLACCTSPFTDLAAKMTTPFPTNVLGSNFTFTLSLTNLGPDPAAAISVTNSLPAGATFVTASVSQGTWSNAGSNILITFTNLASNGVATASLTVFATNSGAFTNLARATSSAIDPNPTNNLVSAIVIVPADFDGDGIPDAWELANGLSPTNAADALKDLDGDGLSNQQEYLAGTNPNDSRNFLRIISVVVIPPDAQISFSSVAGKSYRVERNDDVATNAWPTVTNNIPGTGASVLVTDPAGATQPRRTYRVRLLP